MRSTDLRSFDLTLWHAFNRGNARDLVAGAPSEPGIYVIRCRTDLTLARGASDILYIGKATNRDGVRMRLRQYFHPGATQSTNKRLLARCGDSQDYEVAYGTTPDGATAVMSEKRLLDEFRAEHGQCPPENLRG